jgi:hypothetical protein
MDWLTAAATLGAGYLGSRAAKSAAQTAAETQQKIGEQAAEMSQFKPYTVTTGFGTGYFDEEAQRAGYELDPVLQAYRDELMNLGAAGLPTTMDVGARSADYYQQMQDVMAPTRTQEDLALRQNLFGSGRLGMRLAGEAAGAGAGGMYQPDVLGQQRSRAMADQALAMQARQQAQNELDAQIARGTGLMQQAFGVEQLGMSPLTTGAEFGGRASQAGAQAAQGLLTGGLGAAQANLAAGLNQANLYQNLGLGLMKFNQPQTT